MYHRAMDIFARLSEPQPSRYEPSINELTDAEFYFRNFYIDNIRDARLAEHRGIDFKMSWPPPKGKTSFFEYAQIACYALKKLMDYEGAEQKLCNSAGFERPHKYLRVEELDPLLCKGNTLVFSYLYEMEKTEREWLPRDYTADSIDIAYKALAAFNSLIEIDNCLCKKAGS
jgi:hypothetical protein